MVPNTILQVLTPKQEMASQGIHVTAWFIEDQEFYIYTEQNYMVSKCGLVKKYV